MSRAPIDLCPYAKKDAPCDGNCQECFDHLDPSHASHNLIVDPPKQDKTNDNGD